MQAVILDWAGTVQDYGSRAPLAAFLKTFENEGVTVTPEEARIPMGAYKKDHIRQMTQMESVAAKWLSVHGTLPTEADVERMYHAFVPLQLDCLKTHAKMIPGALETYHFIKNQGWLIGTTTGYTSEMLAIIVEEAEKEGYIPDYNVASNDVAHGRPHPDMVLENLQTLKVAPLHAVKVDDTLPGIREGLNAGAWTVYVAHTGNGVGLTEEELAALEPEAREALLKAAEEKGRSVAHFTIGTIAELPDILMKIDGLIKAGCLPGQENIRNYT